MSIHYSVTPLSLSLSPWFVQVVCKSPKLALAWKFLDQEIEIRLETSILDDFGADLELPPPLH